jgi:phosphonate transport system substrate-binding protein
MNRRNCIIYLLLFISGCTATTSISESENSSLEPENQPKILRFTVTDIQTLADLEKSYGGLKTALAEILQTTVEFVTIESYTAAATALQADRLDFVLTGPSEYIIIRARTNAMPVIAITRPNYRTVICVNANAKISSLTELKGKKIAFWKIGSTSGYLGPTKLFIDAGINPKSDIQTLMLAEKGLPALQKGEVDAWAGSAVKYEKYLQDQKLPETAFPVIAKGPILPNDLFVASSKLAPVFVNQIQWRMLQNQEKLIQSLLSVEEGKYKGSVLVKADDADYNIVRDVYKAIGQGNFIQ